MATKEDCNIAETRLQSNQDNEMQPTDNPVVDQFAVVSDQHSSQLHSGRDSTQSTNLPVSNTSTCSAVMANKGDPPPNQSKQTGCTSVDTTPTNALMSQTISLQSLKAKHVEIPRAKVQDL